jgi:hypothetical protein
MVDDAPPHNPDDGGHDDLAALDFTAEVDASEESDLDALGGCVALEEAGDDERPVPLFTLTNPPGTVTVTTFMDGRVHQIDLSPNPDRCCRPPR